MASLSQSQSGQNSARSGLLAGLGVYLFWGVLPLLFHYLEKAGALLVTADRTLFALVVVGVVLAVSGRFREVGAALKDRRTMLSMLISSLLLAVNWLIYIWAVQTDQLLEASFGYFINPIVNVAIGMVFLHERQNRWQAVAIGIAVFAIGLQALGLGRIPYVALSLAFSFGFYGFFRKTAKVSSAGGLFVETMLLTPLAIGYLIFSFARDGGVGVHADPYYLGLLLLTGPATALPLLLFAFAVRRLRLTTMGMLQYIAPSMAFVLAVTLFGEELNSQRLLSFGLIWLSLLVFSADSYFNRRVALPPV